MLKTDHYINDTWNADLYDTKHSFVSEYGNQLLEWLAPKAGEKILDLGCGTGDLAKKLHDFNVDVVGIDHSPNMIIQAKQKYPEIPFLVQNATALEYQNEFDAVFSNATLHWIKSPKQALSCIHQSLKPDGRFVAEFGGKGNVQTITDGIYQQVLEEGLEYDMEHFPWYYPSIGEYSSLMEEVGFKVTLAHHSDRPTPLYGENGLRDWIEMFGSALFEGIGEEQRKAIITKTEHRLKAVLFKEGNWIADYKRIRVIGIKEK
jgi:trans-aconitate methyltransferase